jgi:predicted NodU family carbamoyl transferase
VAATQEERFSRKKHDASFPGNAVACCLAEERIQLDRVDYLVFHDKPFVTFERRRAAARRTCSHGSISKSSAASEGVKRIV